jgi:hypothetical protein
MVRGRAPSPQLELNSGLGQSPERRYKPSGGYNGYRKPKTSLRLGLDSDLKEAKNLGCGFF